MFNPPKIVFDVDGTLITFTDEPKYDVINILLSFHKLGYQIDVHSGGGQSYAQMWVERLGLTEYVSNVYGKCRITKDYVPRWDIAFDDESVAYGRVHLKV